ncbi:MAG: DUF1571 domain-containing protein [Acidobacteria bacterium]|nr:DUF1571 domain-containing protein [Acidobacteriota bacterium]
MWAGHTSFLGALILTAPFFAGGPLFAERPPDALKTLAQMSSRAAELTSYSATFIKQERLGDVLAPEEEIELVVANPREMRMRWVGERFKGQEIVFDGTKGVIRGHRGGLLAFFTFTLSPTDPRAASGNHHPITDHGIGKLAERVASTISGAAVLKTALEECAGYMCIRIRADFEDTESALATVIVCVDRQTMLPVALELYDPPDTLYERYEYRDLKIGVAARPDRAGL